MPGITYYCVPSKRGGLAIDTVSCEEDDAWSYEPYEIDAGLFSWTESGVLYKHEFDRDLDKPVYLRRPPWERREVLSDDSERLELALRLYLSSLVTRRGVRVVGTRRLSELNLGQLNELVVELCEDGIF